MGGEGFAGSDACVINCVIDPGKCRNCLFNRRLDGGFLGSIHFDWEDFEVGVVGFELGDGCGEGRGVDVAEGEVADAVAGQGVGCELADTWMVWLGFRTTRC